MKSRVRIDTVGPAVQNRPPSHTHTAPCQPPLTRKGSLRSGKSRPFVLSVMLVIVLGTATGSSASSQSLTGPAAISLGAQPGARVRVVESDSAATSQIGTVAAVGQDGMTIRRDHPGDSLALKFAGIDRLDLSRGRHGHALIGLGIGVAAGGLAGALWGVSASSHSSREFDIGSAGVTVAAGAILGGAVGAIVGPVVGAFVRTERWHTVWMRSVAAHAHASLDLVPNPTGSRLGLRIAARL
jgi:hypothetical protein